MIKSLGGEGVLYVYMSPHKNSTEYNQHIPKGIPDDEGSKKNLL